MLTLASKGTIDEWILKRAAEKKLIDNQVIQAGMFNATSTQEDRQVALEDILKEGLNAPTADDLPTEEAVNEMVARSDEEFLLFQVRHQSIPYSDVTVASQTVKESGGR